MHAVLLAQYAIGNPVGILLKILVGGMPILYAQVSTLIINLEVLLIISNILTPWKTVEPHQRIHVETTHGRLVLHHLAHQVHTAI